MLCDVDDIEFPIQAVGGGVAIDGGAHWIRPLRMLVGELDEVRTVGSVSALKQE